MFYTGLDPRTMKPVFVARSSEDKAMQRALMQFSNPRNHDLVRKALRLAGREDLIGRDRECLVPPERDPVRDARRNAKRDNPAHERKAIRHADKQPQKPRRHGRDEGNQSHGRNRGNKR